MANASDQDTSEDSQYDGIIHFLQQLLAQKRPRDPLLSIHQAVEERMEQRDSRTLSGSGVNLSPPGGLARDWTRCGGVAMLGIDVGGSLSKITFFERDDMGSTVEAQFVKSSERYGTTGIRDMALSFKWHDGTFHFLTFETRRMEGAIEMLRRNGLLRNDEVLLATGGGAYKFCEAIRTKLGLRVVKGDELHCLLWGLNFILQHTPNECYYLANPGDPASEDIPFSTMDGSAFPYLLVNIGSGVSILKVDDNNSFQRVSGTMMGGGTFWGLCRLLTDCQTFEEAVELASQGKSDKLNMLVGDIYGGDYEAFGLRAQTVASAFGNVGVNDDIRKTASQADIARGLLDMIAQNIAQLAYLCARKYNLTRIIFAGNFLRKNRLSMSSISFSIDYWSNGVQKALFLKHEGYFGSTGAFFMAETEALSDQANLDLPDADACRRHLNTDLHDAVRMNLAGDSVPNN